MLVVRADAAFARHVFEHEGRGLWSHAVPLVLEKHGYLGVELAGPQALDDPGEWRRHGCVLVGRLPDAVWSAAVVDRILAAGVPVLVEGPAPAGVRAALGVRSAEAAEGELTVVASDAEVAALAKGVGPHVGGHVRPPVSKPLDLEPQLAWETLPSVPIGDRRAAVWREPAWDAEAWTDVEDGARVLASWFRFNTGRRFPAVLARGTLIGCSIGLMTHLGQMHTSEPSSGREWRSSSSVLGLEALLLGVVDLMHRMADVPRPRVRPWPRDARWVLSVRHDVDRAQQPREVRRIVEAHHRTGTAATWYWRARHLEGRRRGTASRSGSRALRQVAGRDGHEVAHHTERPWDGADVEQRLIERVAGRRVLGTSAHGDPTCFRYQGAPNVLWAEHQGMLYTELIQHSHMHPHRFATLGEQGELATLAVMCLPHHRSFEKSTTEGETLADKVVDAVPRFIAAGGLLQVLNHPDIHHDAFFATLGDLPRADRLDWTAAQAADWWRRTHVLDHLRLEARDDALFVRSRYAVEGLAVEVLAPGGTRAVTVVDVVPERPATVPISPAGAGPRGRSSAGTPRAV